ncbi:hypothetical protein JQX13_44745 [Archangium violaceum]|uniref:hypothetical protein n=1 Tax=Archangium violaceum TaxID=83451 RepID=UPI00193BE6D7|nr:hypothetical protein [Archangium violaceum]QRK07091.1 hypothetical protein JQX13_44745 [Archangium violaceum]
MILEVNGEEQVDEEGRFLFPIRRSGTMELELSESGSKLAPVRRTVTVQEEVDLDVGTITLPP